MSISYLKDTTFLKQLDLEQLKYISVKIIVLDLNENPIREITGRVASQGAINLDGRSAMRRTATITFLAEEANNDLQNIDNILSINKKIQLLIGVENKINSNYEDIIWFSMGVYLIIQPNLSHSLQGVTISLTLKDKMCLLNGECGGTLPASITFHSYDQIQADGSIIEVPQLIFDIVQTLVCNYGGVPIGKIIINDIPREIKQIVRYVGTTPLYYNTVTSIFTTDATAVERDQKLNPENNGVWSVFNYNEDVGYTYTNFTYPGELVSGIGETVCSVLDKIKNVLGNFEYFFDVDGNFVFQEVKNYLNNSYDALDDNFSAYRVYNAGKLQLQTNNLDILDVKNYAVDYRSNNRSMYTFEQGTGLVSSFTNSPSYTNIKNDFHVWGQNGDNQVIHYHLALMEKPTVMNQYWVRFPKIDGEYTGEIALVSLEEYENLSGLDGERWVIGSTTDAYAVSEQELLMFNEKRAEVKEQVFYPNSADSEIESYIPEDWRAEMYLQGLRKLRIGQRPTIYEQELVDLFPSIYDFPNKRFKVDIVHNPNNLVYFFDAIEPVGKLHGCSVTALFPKILACQEEGVNKLYDKAVPDIILINQDENVERRSEILERCELEGQSYANIDSAIYKKIAIGTTGYAAHTKVRELLYQHTNYNEVITLQSIPIYYLDVNRRITVHDRASNIYGDYVVNNISIPLTPGGTMSISATRALERI